jgi:hypothetical protein
MDLVFDKLEIEVLLILTTALQRNYSVAFYYQEKSKAFSFTSCQVFDVNLGSFQW